MAKQSKRPTSKPEQDQEVLFWSDDIYQTTGSTANDEYIYQKHIEYIREVDEKWRKIRAEREAAYPTSIQWDYHDGKTLLRYSV